MTEPVVTVGVPESDPDYAAALHAALLIEQQVDNLHGQIMGLADNAIIFLDENNQISGAELKQLWNNIDYLVTDQNYGPGRGGQVDNNVAQVNYETILNGDQTNGYYVHAGEAGVIYYALHELAHTTPEGETRLSLAHSTYLNAYPDPNTRPPFYESPQGVGLEQFTNGIYRDIADAVGAPLWSTPPHGF